jgi:hypothetical protein
VTIEILELGAVRPDLSSALAQGAATAPRTALVVVVGAVGAIGLAAAAAPIEELLVEAFRRVGAFGLDSGGIVLVVDELAVLGDPDAVADSVAAGGFTSFGRALALEVARAGGNVSTVFAATIERADDASADAGAVAERIVAIAGDPALTNGQEIFVGGGAQLGRVRM